MPTRRTLIKAAAAAGLFTPFGGFAASPAKAEGAPAFRFGIIADPQYAPFPPKPGGSRYYANSLWKLSEAIGTFNGQDLQFVATLGDIIDRNWDSFGDILPIYDTLRHDHFFVLGNHDYEVGQDYLRSVVRTVGMPRAYYDFSGGGYRFIVIDGNDVSLFAPPAGDPRLEIAAERLAKLKETGAENAHSWNGSLSDEQFAWLGRTIEEAKNAGEKVIVLSHYPVYPDNMHNLWDSERIVELLTGHDHVVAFFNGHNHAGNYGEVAGTHFVNFQGMVETPAHNAYAVLEVYEDRLEISGFGREPSRSLRIGATRDA
ncbi:metallophosphoesterase [Chelativorans sp. AA-79]|uniref:metallophosphoesterase n=1 Tax=Chelativorans sp. AA-79 TaxID=3028735 RepID=UPI0023F93A54|nr:metallophosphoesterase [Chelativorans sp. AA-79]WEX11245.1 phosphatase [Chelativorans sp. AA-79]